MFDTARLSRPALCALAATLTDARDTIARQARMIGAGPSASVDAIDRELVLVESELYRRDTAPTEPVPPAPPAPTPTPARSGWSVPLRPRRVSLPNRAGRSLERIARAGMLRAVAAVDPLELASQAPDLYRELTAPAVGGAS